MPLFPSVGGSGGISLKPSLSMDAMRADMGGAATVCASVVTAAALKLPINIIGGLWHGAVRVRTCTFSDTVFFISFPPDVRLGSTV